MSIFVDASALVAYIVGEPERRHIADTLNDEADILSSAMACWETVVALRYSYAMSVEQARGDVENTRSALGMRMVPIADRELAQALDAYQRYGKGRHPAGLNMGDCFAYACAKVNSAKLLYKGADFAKTDLA